jgi:hypothetical protein
MSNPIGSYSFLPWLRQGLANQITASDFDNSVKLRATVNVQLEARGDSVSGGSPQLAPFQRPIALFGPGDIVGIDKRTIFRSD